MSAVVEGKGRQVACELVPLKDLGRWSGGGTPSKSRPEFWEEGTIPWVSPKDMKSEHIADSKDHITETASKESAAKLISAGSVLIVTRSGILSHTLPVAVSKVPVTINQDLKALTPIEGVLPEYVAWALRCFAREILNTCSKQGTTVSSIETAALHRFEIPVAPLDQQKRIVAEIEKQFSRLDEAVANLKRVKANLKRYKAAVLKAAVEGRLVETEAELARREGRSYETGEQLLQRILETRRRQWQGKGKYKEPAAPDTSDLPELPEGWVCATIGQAAECLDSMRIPVNKKERLKRNGDIPYYGANGQVGVIDDFIFDEPLVLVVEDETFTGRELPFSYKISGKSWVNNHAHVLRATGMVSVDFLNYALSFYPFTPLTTGTTGRKKLTQLALVRAPLRIPPLREQSRIVSEIDRRLSLLSETEAQVDANLLRAERLRQAILTSAFAGNVAKHEKRISVLPIELVSG